jgi:hypothetical protein
MIGWNLIDNSKKALRSKILCKKEIYLIFESINHYQEKCLSSSIILTTCRNFKADVWFTSSMKLVEIEDVIHHHTIIKNEHISTISKYF